tara:strand:+ start:2287 stop:3117 length:831 start_codon:yes stop_codon:yes gene_type:complete
MKNRHNKKRNTAFVYEALIKEATAAVLKGDHEQKQKVVDVIKKYFNSSCILSKDLDCYRSLYETRGLSEKDSRRLIETATADKRMIDPTGLFKIQSQMIGDINKEIDSDIFNNFVPNYKTLATIDQLFSVKTTPKNRIMLENEMVQYMTEDENVLADDKVDNVVIETFVKKFNQKYSDDLLEEQKALLTHYISSFTDNSLELKVYLNKEITRLKEQLFNARNVNEIKEDKDMSSKLEQVIEKLNAYSSSEINDEVLLTVLKTQNLTKEIFANGADD